MKIYVKAYATLTKYFGGSIMYDPIEVEVAEGLTLKQLYKQLGIPDDEVKIAFVNSTMQPSDYKLKADDQVGVFPPVGGG